MDGHKATNISLSTGLIIYFAYGVRHSVQKQRLQNSRNQVTVNRVTPGVDANLGPEPVFS